MALYRNILKVKNPPSMFPFFQPYNINISVTRKTTKHFLSKPVSGKKNLTESRDCKLNNIINTY